MRALITGGAGLIGKATTERLLRQGWDVRVIDRAAGVEIAGAEYAVCDILNYDALLEQMHGCDGVIHLAAIRSPNLAPNSEVFQVNAAGTFNVFEAAAALGIKRIAQASSINALGCYYGIGEIEPRYFPIDENHPTFTTDAYSFSKQVVESIGAYYWRRDGISSVALRFPGVYRAGFHLTDNYRRKREIVISLTDELTRLPEAERRARIADVRQRGLDFRRERPLEYHPEPHPTTKMTFLDDPLFWLYTRDRFNFFAAIDERDAAQSLEKGLTADYEGDHVLFINDDHNVPGYDVHALIRVFYPEVTTFKRELEGSESLVSIQKARQLIGFAPEYSVASLETS